MAAQGSDLHVASVRVFFDGTELPPELRGELIEARIKENLALPASALVRLRDPDPLESQVDNGLFNVGKGIEIKVGGMDERSVTSVFKGEIVALEPEWEKAGCVIALRAYDRSHRLQRASRVRTFQQSSASDIVKKILGEYAIPPGKVDSTNVVHEFFMQSGETDRDLIRRFERAYDYRFYIEDGKYNFVKAANLGKGTPIELKFGETLMTFRPRITSVQQVDQVSVRGWDPKRKAEIVGTAANGTPNSRAGAPRSSVMNKFGSQKVLVRDRVVENSGEANAVAKSTLDRMSDAYVEASGSCLGDPRLRAGKKVKVANVGTRFGGEYILTSVTHSFRGEKGFYTTFEISGSSARGLLDLMHPPPKRDWTSNLVVAVVTNTKDPDGLGRVKVKYPVLPDQATNQPAESFWARVVTLAASNQRGILMMPEVNDEVVVAFENGDARRPLVIGALFGGVNKPGTELLDAEAQVPKGSFAVVSNKRGYVRTKEDLVFKSDKKMILEITGDREEKTQANLKSEASSAAELKAGTSYTIEAGSSMKLKGASVEIEATGSLTLKGATVEIKSSGPAKLTGATVDVQGSAMTNIKGGIVNLG